MSKTIYSDENKNIANKLVEARLQAGLKQEEAAKLLQKTQSYLSKVEAGQIRLDVPTLKEFARIYKTNLSYLIGKSE